MAYRPIPAVNYGRYGYSGTINVDEYSRTGNALTNPDAANVNFQAALNQSLQNILFGDDDESSSTIFSTNFLGGIPSGDSPILSSGSFTYPSNFTGGTTYSNVDSSSTQLIEFFAKANLVGKNVVAINPSTGQRFTGEVKSISIEKGSLQINVDGTIVGPTQIISVTT